MKELNKKDILEVFAMLIGFILLGFFMMTLFNLNYVGDCEKVYGKGWEYVGWVRSYMACGNGSGEIKYID